MNGRGWRILALLLRRFAPIYTKAANSGTGGGLLQSMGLMAAGAAGFKAVADTQKVPGSKHRLPSDPKRTVPLLLAGGRFEVWTRRVSGALAEPDLSTRMWRSEPHNDRRHAREHEAYPRPVPAPRRPPIEATDLLPHCNRSGLRCGRCKRRSSPCLTGSMTCSGARC